MCNDYSGCLDTIIFSNSDAIEIGGDGHRGCQFIEIAWSIFQEDVQFIWILGDYNLFIIHDRKISIILPILITNRHPSWRNDCVELCNSPEIWLVETGHEPMCTIWFKICIDILSGGIGVDRLKKGHTADAIIVELIRISDREGVFADLQEGLRDEKKLPISYELWL